MSTTVPAIEAHGLTKEFGGTRAVDAVDLLVPAGGVFALLGTNGAGKTTTVRMLATLLRPDAGTARIFGHDVVAEATAVRSLIGVTGQYASVDEDLTARENLMIFGRLIGSSRRRARLRADELLEEFGLGAVAARRVGHFSGGMRRRLDLAASLITRPRLLFLDEPTTGLDPRTRAQMWQTVREMVARGSTVLLTTQYLDEADELADHIAVMDRGRVVADGTADELKAGVGDMSVKLQLARSDDLAVAAQVCAPFTSNGDATVARHDGVLVLPMSDIDPLADILGALRARGIALTSVNVVRPTLDEVFFALTDGGDPSRSGPDAADRLDTTGARA